MKTFAISAALSVALLALESQAAFKLKLAKTNEPTTLRKRHILPRQNVYLELLNNKTGGSYAAQISVGTPAQPQNLAIDTGSSDVWFMESRALRCSDPVLVAYLGGCSSVFNSRKSTSIKLAAENRFNISYLDGSGASGDYVYETLNIGDETVKSQIVGLGFDVTLRTGIMGIGFGRNVASNNGRRPFTYPTLVDSMFSQGLINLKAYSLYLDSKDSKTGSVIFGGLDSDKYVGNLFQLPIVPTRAADGSAVYDHFAVVMTSLQMTNGTSTQNFTSARYRVAVVLDSGTTLTYLPETTTRQIYTQINAIDDTKGRDPSGYVYVDCGLASNPLSFNYRFGDSRESVEIRVPISELVYPLNETFSGTEEEYLSYIPDLPFKDICVFGISPALEGIALLGDTFLRSAYVVYDLSNNLVAMAQANADSKSESIVEFRLNATAIPRVSGIASDVEATQTATFAGGPGNGGNPRPTGTVTSKSVTSTSNPNVVTSVVTVTSPASSTASTTAARNASPRVAGDMSAYAVLGASISFALLGSGWFIA